MGMIDMEPWRERTRAETAQFEAQLEALGAIAYRAGEMDLLIVFEGGVLRIDARAYPEGGWLEVNGMNVDLLTEDW